MTTSKTTYKGKVIRPPYYDLAEVEFVYGGKTRRIPIDHPSGYARQHALIGSHVQFTIVQCPVFTSDIGFAHIENW